MDIKSILINNRTKSFLWRTGMMILAVVITQIVELLPFLEIPSQVVVVLGLVLGEVSKWLNKNIDLHRLV